MILDRIIERQACVTLKHEISFTIISRNWIETRMDVSTLSNGHSAVSIWIVIFPAGNSSSTFTVLPLRAVVSHRSGL